MKIDPVTFEVDASGGTRPVYVWEAPVRVWHWLMAVAMFAMIITGYLIGRPLVSNLGDTWITYDFGYMRMVHTPLLAAFPNRVVNLHPALLPSFTGAHAIDDAFARGVKVTGVTVHFANEIYDNGPIIAQRALAVEEGWEVDTLEEHIHAIEHVLYPEVVQMLADGRVHVLESGKVAIDAPRG